MQYNKQAYRIGLTTVNVKEKLVVKSEKNRYIIYVNKTHK